MMCIHEVLVNWIKGGLLLNLKKKRHIHLYSI